MKITVSVGSLKVPTPRSRAAYIIDTESYLEPSQVSKMGQPDML